MFLAYTTGPCTMRGTSQRQIVVMNWNFSLPSMEWLVTVMLTSPIWGPLLWLVWEGFVRPRLIPAAEIEALAEEMIATYGPHAEEAAFVEEDRAWRASRPFEQGQWRRVGAALRRRRAVHAG